MSTDCCSVSSCGKPGKLLCSGCASPPSRYCSKGCQERDWKAHKLVCAGAQKYNCFLIRASSTSTKELKSADCIEPFGLQAYGNEGGERSELKRRLGWGDVKEIGKFYDHRGADTWYYYVYGSSDSQGNSSAENEIASLCIGDTIYGDVAVVRSGPVDSNSYSTIFSKAELVGTAEFYKTACPVKVFQDREKKRAMRKWGFGV